MIMKLILIFMSTTYTIVGSTHSRDSSVDWKYNKMILKRASDFFLSKWFELTNDRNNTEKKIHRWDCLLKCD